MILEKNSIYLKIVKAALFAMPKSDPCELACPAAKAPNIIAYVAYNTSIPVVEGSL